LLSNECNLYHYILVAMRTGGDDEEWDVANHLAPMSDRLAGAHGWSPLEVCSLLEELMVGLGCRSCE
jgi:hypothetical protein